VLRMLPSTLLALRSRLTPICSRSGARGIHPRSHRRFVEMESFVESSWGTSGGPYPHG